MIKPFYIAAFIHGWKHGQMEKEGNQDLTEVLIVSPESEGLAEKLSDDMEVAGDLASKLQRDSDHQGEVD
jgi:hypothetical protein